MFDIIDSAKNAIDAYSASLRITSSNIANAGTSGFKGSTAHFQHIFERVMQRGSAASPFENIGGINPMVIGGTATLSNVAMNFSQGNLTDGGVTDMAVRTGSGMFVLTSDGGRTREFTRSGNFTFDTNGNLVTQTGLQVLGFRGSVDAAGNFTRTGDLEAITFQGTGRDTGTLAWDDQNGVLRIFTRTDDGTVALEGTALASFQIAVARVPNPSGLLQTSSTNFSVTAASGEATIPAPPAAGTVAGRRLEQSNVDFISQTIRSLEDQRAINSLLSMVRLSSDLISTFIQRLG